MKAFAPGVRVVWCALFALLLLPCTAALAQQEIERRILPLKLGGSEVIEIQKPSLFMKVLTSDEEIVAARPLTERRIYVRGQKLGYCTITVWDEQQKETRAVIDVTVTLDLTGLKEQLRRLFPAEEIEVHGSETGVVLAGTVSGPEVMEKVLRLAQTFLPRQAEDKGATQGTGRSGPGLTNLLQIAGGQQVMLEVRFAEVSRDKGRDWQAALGLVNQGKDLLIGAGAGRLTGKFITGYNTDGTPIYDVRTLDAGGGGIPDVGIDPGSLLLNFAGNAANIFMSIDNLTMALQFLESEGLARTLAEPRLVTLSGQEASFLAGGEFPYPVPDNEGNPSIEFKEFGVGLRFTPVVMADGRISLRVAPSVSEISGTTPIPTGITGTIYPVPNLTTRKLETTVHLRDGQTLALAGLLQDSLRETSSKVPGLGDLPVIGPLFRSSGYQQQKTDLLIAVTPRLVKPVAPEDLRFPGASLIPPDRLEFYLEGRFEGSRTDDDSADGAPAGTSASPAPAAGKNETGGLEGDFGFQTTALTTGRMTGHD